MVVDLVEVRDRSDDVGANVSLAIECFHPPPDSAVAILYEFGLLRVEVHVILVCSFAVHPLFHFDYAGAVIDFVGYVRGLCGNIANLPNESDLTYGVAIDLEVGIWVWLMGIEGLLHGNGPNSVFAVCLQRLPSAEAPQRVWSIMSCLIRRAARRCFAADKATSTSATLCTVGGG